MYARAHSADERIGTIDNDIIELHAELNMDIIYFKQYFNSGGSIGSEVEETIKNIEALMKLTEELIPKTEDVKVEEIGDMVESEMQMTSKAIEQAAKKIEVHCKAWIMVRP